MKVTRDEMLAIIENSRVFGIYKRNNTCYFGEDFKLELEDVVKFYFKVGVKTVIYTLNHDNTYIEIYSENGDEMYHILKDKQDRKRDKINKKYNEISNKEVEKKLDKQLKTLGIR